MIWTKGKDEPGCSYDNIHRPSNACQLDLVSLFLVCLCRLSTCLFCCLSLPQPPTELISPYRSSLVGTKFLRHRITRIGQCMPIAFFPDLLDRRQVTSHTEYDRLCLPQASQSMVFAAQIGLADVDDLPFDHSMCCIMRNFRIAGIFGKRPE